MTVVLKGAQVFHRGAFSGGDVSVSFGDRVFCKDIVFPSSLNVSSFTILPGFVDVHVFRTDGADVDLTNQLQNLAQWPLRRRDQGAGIK